MSRAETEVTPEQVAAFAAKRRWYYLADPGVWNWMLARQAKGDSMAQYDRCQCGALAQYASTETWGGVKMPKVWACDPCFQRGVQ